jgi:hypothetical protein
MTFLFFCEFFLNEKSEVKFFRLRRSALKRGIQRCIIHYQIMFNKGATDADSNEIAVSYCICESFNESAIQDQRTRNSFYYDNSKVQLFCYYMPTM